MKTEPIRIFIIEDDDANSALLKQEIEAGFSGRKPEVLTFKTGEQCHLVHQQPDIAIVDYQLNRTYKNAMNGIRIIERFKDQSPDTDIILLLGEESSYVAKEAMILGVKDCVLKNDWMFLKLKAALQQAMLVRELKTDLKKQRTLAALALISLSLLASFVGIALLLPD